MVLKKGVVATGPKMTELERAIADFQSHLRARRVSPSTVRAYRDVLERIFLPWATERGLVRPSELTTRTMTAYAAWLTERRKANGEPLGHETIRTYTRHVAGFVKWLAGEGEDVGRVPVIAKGRQLPDVLDRAEIAALEDAAPTERDKLLIRLLGDTGLRLAELLQLRTEDVFRAEDRHHYLAVHGKGRRDRQVPIPADLYRRLRGYIDRGRPRDGETDHLFLSSRRDNGSHPPATAASVEAAVRNAAERAALGKRVYPHLLRHSAATNMLRRGMSPLHVARILGHSNLTMLDQVYAHLSVTDLAREMVKALRDD